MDTKHISPNIPSSQKIWRYMSLDKLINLLDSETLFFTPISWYASTDPFEGLIPRAGLDAIGKTFMASKDGMIRNLNSVKEYSLKKLPKGHVLPKEYMDRFDQIEDEINNHPMKMDEIYFNLMRNAVVNCWHQNDYESEAMWKLYSDSNKGVAIETTAGDLIDSIVDDKKNRLFFSEVKYIDFESPEIKPGDCIVNGILGILLKRIAFRHENEARLFFLPEKNYTIPQDSIPRAENIKVDINKLIHKIYISPYASEPFPSSVHCIMKKFNFPEERIITSKLLSPEDKLLRIF